MTIRTRTFLALWLITFLAIGAIGFVAFSLTVVASRMDAERERIGEVRELHSALWRTLVEIKHDQHDFDLTQLYSLRDRVEQHERAVRDYTTRIEALVRDPAQIERLSRLRLTVDRWMAAWNQASRAPAVTTPEVLLSTGETEFAPIEALLAEFKVREDELWNNALNLMARRRRLFFFIVGSYAIFSVLALGFVMVSAKRQVLDPLTELTAAAHQIEQGDFTAAHQTLRSDEIGVLINSFAKMVQAVQVRERELAMALTDSRELASVTAESRRRVEAAHADLLATLETVPAALLIFNVDGGVRLRNRAATDVFGIEPQNPELRRNYWARFKRIAKDGSEIPADQWISARALRGETVKNEELEIHHPDGRVFPILASGAPLRNELGHVAGAVVAFQDISRLREVDRRKLLFKFGRTPLSQV